MNTCPLGTHITNTAVALKAKKQATADVLRLPPMSEEWEARYNAALDVHGYASSECDRVVRRGCPANHGRGGRCTCDPEAPEVLAAARAAAVVNQIYNEMCNRNRDEYHARLRHSTRAWWARREYWKESPRIGYPTQKL